MRETKVLFGYLLMLMALALPCNTQADDVFAEPPPPKVNNIGSKLQKEAESWKGWEQREMTPSPKTAPKIAARSSVSPPTSLPPEVTMELPQPNVASAVAVEGQVFPQPDVLLESPGFGESWEYSSPSFFIPTMLGDMIPRRDLIYRKLAGGYKIADNNSPVPLRRGLYSFNYFNNPFELGGNAFQHTAGLELWGFNRRASLDLRWSLATFTEPEGSRTSFPSDFRATFKTLFVDRFGLKVSGGVGTSIPVGGEPSHTHATSVLISPFVGWILTSDDSRWFVHGFEQFDIAFSHGNPMMLQSDVGVGYWLRRSPSDTITGIAPTAELHLYSPFGGDSEDGGSKLPRNNILNATVGMTVFFGASDSLAIGVGTPLFSRRDYEVEAHLHYNHRF